VTADNKAQAYAEVQRLFEESRGDTMVLARYMQILSPELCAAYPGQDHQHPPQLPAQLRRRQALPPGLQRGVKLIGATCHYVTDRSSTRARSSSRT
jgi:formyltetrahydrofolate deformylase